MGELYAPPQRPAGAVARRSSDCQVKIVNYFAEYELNNYFDIWCFGFAYLFGIYQKA